MAEGDEMLTFVTREENEYKLPASVMKQSGLVATFLSEEDDRGDKIELLDVADNEFQKIVEFLQKNKEDPILRIKRPLKSDKLTDSGVTEWADKFIKATPIGQELLDLIDAAAYMQIEMLKYLGCARIAAEIKAVGVEKLKAQYKIDAPLTAEEEAELKKQNEWAWKHPDKDVVAEGVEEAEGAPAEGDAPAAGAGAGAGAEESKTE